MKPRYLIPPAIALVACIAGAAVLFDVDASRRNGFAREMPAVAETTTTIDPEKTFSPHVDRHGKISLPQDYKKRWTHLGSWAVAKKPGNTIHEMHGVYTQPETIVAFTETGKFPDGAILLKEVRETKADQLTTGHSSWSTDIKLWFVMIKDRQDRFKDSDHWGDGWGWALFEAKDPSKNVSAGYDTSCLSCHLPAKDSDLVYMYGYPALKKPK